MKVLILIDEDEVARRAAACLRGYVGMPDTAAYRDLIERSLIEDYSILRDCVHLRFENENSA